MTDERAAVVAYLRKQAEASAAAGSRAIDPRLAATLHRRASIIRRMANDIRDGRHMPAVPSTIGPDDPTPIAVEPAPGDSESEP